MDCVLDFQIRIYPYTRVQKYVMYHKKRAVSDVRLSLTPKQNTNELAMEANIVTLKPF